MIREITLGQYYQADSVIHRLDPRVKLVGTILYIVSLFLFKKAAPYVLAVIFLAAVISLSKVPFSYMVRGLKAIMILLLITAAFNIFLTSGEPLAKVWIFTITREGVINAVFIAIRLVLLIIGSSLMTLTTTPNQLTDAMEKLMHPLTKIKVPVHEISMMMSIALRFIPILLEETDKIMKAQMARGADFKKGNPVVRLKKLRTVILPLFQNAISRAGHLGDAMDSRCYTGGKGRTKLHPLVYERRDVVAYVCMLAMVIASVVLIVKF